MVDPRLEIPLGTQQVQCLIFLAVEWDCSPSDALTRVLSEAVHTALSLTPAGYTTQQYEDIMDHGAPGSPVADTDAVSEAQRRFEEEIRGEDVGDAGVDGTAPGDQTGHL